MQLLWSRVIWFPGRDNVMSIDETISCAAVNMSRVTKGTLLMRPWQTWSTESDPIPMSSFPSGILSTIDMHLVFAYRR